MDKKAEYQEWLKYANDDLETAFILSEQHKKSYNIICYHCQQTAEKQLKAFLVFKEITFEKTHDLLKLNKLCNTLDSSFSELKNECIALNPYSIITRYPSELELIEQDIIDALNDASKIKKHIAKIIATTN